MPRSDIFHSVRDITFAVEGLQFFFYQHVNSALTVIEQGMSFSNHFCVLMQNIAVFSPFLRQARVVYHTYQTTELNLKL